MVDLLMLCESPRQCLFRGAPPARRVCDDEAMNPLASFAAEIAPHIDRLVVAVHQQMRAAKPAALAEWQTASGLERPGLLINLRPFILAGSESEETLRRLHRYALHTTVDDSIAAARMAGLLEPESFAATDKARTLARRLTDLQTDLLNQLWGDRAEVDLLVPIFNRLVDCIPPRYPGRGFELARAFARLPRPMGSAAYLVHHLATSLRYLRADCHAEVVAEAELTPTQAVLLTEAWRSGEPVGDRPPEGLLDRGLLTEHGELTEEGRSFRDAIEAETNSTAAAIWEAVDDPSRSRALSCVAALEHQRGEAWV